MSWPSRFPSGIPAAVHDAYGVGVALERLRRLRNRGFHYEPILHIAHAARLKGGSTLLRGINHESPEGLKPFGAPSRCARNPEHATRGVPESRGYVFELPWSRPNLPPVMAMTTTPMIAAPPRTVFA